MLFAPSVPVCTKASGSLETAEHTAQVMYAACRNEACRARGGCGTHIVYVCTGGRFRALAIVWGWGGDILEYASCVVWPEAGAEKAAGIRTPLLPQPAR